MRGPRRGGKGFLSRLAGLLAKTEQPRPPAAPKAAAQEPAQAEDPFRIALQDVLREDQGRFETRLHVISLVEFREAIGDKWGKVAEKVMLIAEGVIQLHLGAGNAYGRQGQDFFVLLFRDCDPFESRSRALAIAKELGTRLVGDKVLGPARPLALAAEVPLDALKADGTLNLFLVNQAVDEMRSIIAAQAEESLGDDGLRSWMKQRLTEKPQQGLRRHMMPSAPPPPKQAEPLRASLKPSHPPPPAAPAAPRPRVPAKAPVALSGLVETTAAADPCWQPLNPDALPDADPHLAFGLPLPPDVRLSQLWRPTWVAEGEAIGAYRAQIQRKDAPAAVPLEGAQAYTGGDETAHSLDRFAIGNAMRAFAAAEAASLGATMVLPVHWATLRSPRRTGFLAPLGDVTTQSRTARLVLEVFGVPGDADVDEVASVLQSLRPMCRAVAIRAGLTKPLAGRAAQAGATLLAADLSELATSGTMDDERLLSLLAAFRSEAANAGLGACLWGARRRRVVTGAVLGGFAMVNGPALMKDLARPAKVLPAPKAKFG